MAKASKKNFIEMKKEELAKELEALQGAVRDIRFKMEGSRPKNVKEMANLKKNIARILTAMKTK